MHGSRRLRRSAAVPQPLSEGDDLPQKLHPTRSGVLADAAYSIRHTPCRYSLLTASVCQLVNSDWPYGVIAKNGALSHRHFHRVAHTHSSHNRRPHFSQAIRRSPSQSHSNPAPL